jgi:nicotinate-nucleotide pyrophosphorylase (carboxylating)
LDVEVRNEDEANEAIAAGADIVMLDNIEGSELASVTSRLRSRWAGEGKKFLLETSGGITESNLMERAIAGEWFEAFVGYDGRDGWSLFFFFFARVEIDILSTSAVHQSVPHVDFSLKIQMPPMWGPHMVI